MTSVNEKSLNASLLDGLKGLADSRTFHLYTLCSDPSRDQDIFLYAPQRPKAHVRQILVLLSQSHHDSSSSTPSERVFVCALEAYLYTIPSTQSSILYISKVDSTGAGISARPNPTRTLVSSFIAYFSSPSTRPTPYLWIHVFARAQNQYMFPNSVDHPGKRVLRDINLCKWWKETLALGVRRTAGLEQDRTSLYFVLPGYSSLEAQTMLYSRSAPSATTTAQTNVSASYQWNYGHPYNQTGAPLPCGPAPTVGAGAGAESSPSVRSIAELIPSLPDDPKARFLDEIASTRADADEDTVAPPPRGGTSTSSSSRSAKRPRSDSPSDARESKVPKTSSSSSKSATKGKDKETEKSLEISPASQRALAEVSLDEFWERMAFRQECSQGAVTGFFTAIISPPPISSSAPPPARSSPFAPDAPALPESQPSSVLERIYSTLLNLDFGSTDKAVRATRLVEDMIRAIIRAPSAKEEQAGASPTELSSAPLSEPVPATGSTPTAPSPLPLRDDKSTPVPIPFICGTITTHNPPLPSPSSSSLQSAPPAVTVLQVKKKKKPSAPAPAT